MAARLAQALAAAEAKALLPEGHEALNFSDVFAWQPVAMPAAAASAALPALQVAEDWFRLALLCDNDLWNVTGCSEARALLLSSLAKAGLYTARHSLASFVASFDWQSLGASAFGPNKALDLLHQAHTGLRKFSPLAQNTAWVRDILDGFTSILHQIARVINRRSPGLRWFFLLQRETEIHEVVYIDDETARFWNQKKGSASVVIYDKFAQELMEQELRIGKHLASADVVPLKLSCRSAKARKLMPLATLAAGVDASGTFLGKVNQQVLSPKYVSDDEQIGELSNDEDPVDG